MTVLETLEQVVKELTPTVSDPAKAGRDAAHKLLEELLNQNEHAPLVNVPEKLRGLIYELWAVDSRFGKPNWIPLPNYVQNYLLWLKGATIPNADRCIVYTDFAGELDITGCSAMIIYRPG